MKPLQYDYTGGKLNDLIQIIIEEKAKLFVSAVGVPPKEIVDRLHKAGIPVMNMVGHPKHVQKALDVGVDLICAQAGEGGGHTGDIPASILIPACVDAVKGYKSPLTGRPVYVIGAGAVYDGRGLAANLAWGAQAVCALFFFPSIPFLSYNFLTLKQGLVLVLSPQSKQELPKSTKNSS